MKEEWLMSGAVVPVDVETTAALVAEIKRLIDVVGGMALAQPLPVFAVPVASRKWKSLQEEGYKMQQIRFARDGVTGTIDDWGKVLWEPVQPDNTSKLYEELRSIIDGGSESFTHADAVQYLKDNLAPLKWAPEDTAYRPGGLAQTEQEPVAWPDLSKGMEYAAQDEFHILPPRMRRLWERMSELYASPPKRQLESTTDMMLELADRLGGLPDDIDPRAWEHLLVYAPKRQPLTDAQIWQMVNDCSFNRDLHADKFARAVEDAHGIGDKT